MPSSRKSGLSTFKEFFFIGAGTSAGIGIVRLAQSIIGIIVGYFLIKEGKKMKQKDKKSDVGNILILLGYFFMIGSIGVLAVMFSDDLNIV